MEGRKDAGAPHRTCEVLQTGRSGEPSSPRFSVTATLLRVAVDLPMRKASSPIKKQAYQRRNGDLECHF